MSGTKRPLLFLVSLLLASHFALAQGTTGTLGGTVTHDGSPLPGVTITITSDAMQGTRATRSNVNGDYRFSHLPPGIYEMTFEVEGMQTLTKSVRVSLALTGRADAIMHPEAVAKTMRATEAAPSAIETAGAQATFDEKAIENLTVARSISDVLSLAPAVASTAARRWDFAIRGGFPYDALYLINGAVANENARGRPDNLYTPDAVQETTIVTDLPSAEYGRFTGGVVTVITKSGGNELSGSLRGSQTDSFSVAVRNTDAGPTQSKFSAFKWGEATLGGHILRDRLWFFGAGRYSERDEEDSTFQNSEELRPQAATSETHYEVKLTGQIDMTHSLVGSYLSYKVDQTPYCTGFGCWELSSIDLDGRQLPREMVTANYNGNLTSNFLLEAGYSSRDLKFVDGGGNHVTTDYTDPRDIALGSWGYDATYGGIWGTPLFCAACDGAEEVRENEYYNLKGTWYLATTELGTHNIVAGYENFAESTYANNYQSGSSLYVYVYSGIAPTRVGPVSGPGALRPVISYGDWLVWTPIETPSIGSDFTTESLFLNDEWNLGAKWTFNVGVRYDNNNGTDSAGHPVANASAISPRLGFVHDVKGDGRFRINASYGRYVSKIQEWIAGQAGGGNPSYYFYLYTGPTIGGPDSGMGSFDVLEQVWTWLLAQGWSPDTPLARTTFLGAAVPGLNLRYPDDLKPPYADEVTLGFSAQLGARGFVRLDLIDKNWGDFYTVSTTPGDTVEAPQGTLDVLTYSNCASCVERTYRAAQLQGSWRFTDRLTLGGNYTWSELKGDYFGETLYSGTVPEEAKVDLYREYRDFEQNNPVGRLESDRPHKATVWLSWDQPLGRFGSLNVSLLEQYYSGAPYSAVGQIVVRPYVTNPGYASPPGKATYYFSDRGEYRWDDATETTLSINYEVPLGALSLFLQAAIGNLFDERAMVNGVTNVQILQQFNPFTETPIEGVHWKKAPSFGKATLEGHYQQERYYVVSGGVRF